MPEAAWNKHKVNAALGAVLIAPQLVSCLNVLALLSRQYLPI